MWFKTTAEDGESEGDSSDVRWKTIPEERLRQETLCRRQWTDEYVEHPETSMMRRKGVQKLARKNLCFITI